MTTFSYTGSAQTYVVPTGVTLLQVECWGASGSGGSLGGYAKGTIAVTPGESLQINVGASGLNGGWNGGGTGGKTGGGAADVRQGGSTLAHRVIVGGGGGGAGVNDSGTPGHGGAATGHAGSIVNAFGRSFTGGGGGTQSAGGAIGAGTGAYTTGVTAGTLGVGGSGTFYPSGGTSGAGGGGFYGGGGGVPDSSVVNVGSGGGGGSNFVSGINTVSTQGVQSGNGQVIVTPVNYTPNAPTLLSPVGATVVDFAVSNDFAWLFDDPDIGDTPSAYEFRYRVVGAGGWTTTGKVTSTNSMRTIAGSTFTANDYEWQVRTWDAADAVGPFSASGFFTAAAAPSAVTIDSPVDGGTISMASGAVNWSTAAQESYQVRKVADAAGSPNTAVVYFDSGEVVDTLTRTLALTFPVNNRYEHIQVRRRNGGLLSPWASVREHVVYTPPATPEINVDDGFTVGAILVSAEHPTPVGDEPTVVSMDIYRRDVGDAGDGIRIVALEPPDDTFTDWAVASAKFTTAPRNTYEYLVRAFGDNGSSSDSAWTSTREAYLLTEAGATFITEDDAYLVLN